jgi:hypothetical protein
MGNWRRKAIGPDTVGGYGVVDPRDQVADVALGDAFVTGWRRATRCWRA